MLAVHRALQSGPGPREDLVSLQGGVEVIFQYFIRGGMEYFINLCFGF